MKILSWNVDGLNAILKKGFYDVIKQEDPDFICLQNIRENDAVEINLNNYNLIWNFASDRKGYAGTLILSKEASLNHQLGSDEEGRIILVEYQDFYLINAYAPTSQAKFKRLDYRLAWNQELYDMAAKLKDKPVILAGNLNVAHNPIDLAEPMKDHNKPGFSDVEREDFDKLLQLGLVDSYRYIYPDKTGAYSYFSNLRQSKERNIGWRIDYILVSEALSNKIKNADILKDVSGSEHCPITLDITL